MATHVGILPRDVLDTLLAKLDESNGEKPPEHGVRFLRLPHPRTGVPSLFLPYHPRDAKQTSVLEVQAVAPTNQRSWFMSEGQVIENGRLLIMTPVDPAFLLLPILESTVPTDGSLGTFRPLDDIFELGIEKTLSSPPGPSYSNDPSTRLCKTDITAFLSLDCAHSAMKRVCQVKEITPELTVYRYSPEKVLAYIQSKVARLNSPALFETSRTLMRALAKDGLMEDGKEQLLEAGRLRAACDLVGQYAPPNIRKALLASYDFTSLDAYMQALQDEATSIAAADMSKAEARESKTSAAGEKGGNKRKALVKTSSGVSKLKKANTTGMAKLSTFFQSKS
ncbi:ribonuclease H2, subunit B [Cytidiella melzeri]|nr:ribonuclease H2, subunit B [Cytidiella melzeri]